MTSASTYTYGIDYNPVKGVVTRARGRKKVVQGFLSTDPLTAGYPFYSPYQFAGNKPIWAIDIDGLEEIRVTRSTVNGGVRSVITLVVVPTSDGSTAAKGPNPNKVEFILDGGRPTYGAALAPHEQLALMQRTTGRTMNASNGAQTLRPGTYTATAFLPNPTPPPPPIEQPAPVQIAKPSASEPSTPSPVAAEPPAPILAEAPLSKPKLVTESMDLGSIDFTGNDHKLNRYWGPTLGSDDITDLLAPAVNILRNDPNAFIIINVGTRAKYAHLKPPGGPYKRADELLDGRFNEVARQLKLVDPGIDMSRVKQKNNYGSDIEFSGTLTKTKN